MKKLIALVALGASAYFGGKYLLERRKRRQVELQVAYRQASRDIVLQAHRAGLEVAVVPTVVARKPAITVVMEPGVHPGEGARVVPAVSYGIPVQVVSS